MLLGDDLVRLRPTTLDDVDEWLAGEDDEQIRAFEFPRPSTRDDVVRAVDAWSRSWCEMGPVRQWAVCDPGSGRILGGVEVRDLVDGDVNLSYVVFPFARRRGVATRAAGLALAYTAAEMGAKNAMVKVLAGNAASAGVARGLGAVEVGTEPSDAGGTFVVFRLALSIGDASRASAYLRARPRRGGENYAVGRSSRSSSTEIHSGLLSLE